jgi:hypothetical protein
MKKVTNKILGFIIFRKQGACIIIAETLNKLGKVNSYSAIILVRLPSYVFSSYMLSSYIPLQIA